jgi:hypothetical protein
MKSTPSSTPQSGAPQQPKCESEALLWRYLALSGVMRVLCADKAGPLPISAPHSPYTAPEVAAAMPPGRSPFGISTRAADIWAVGVIMYELLTNDLLVHPDKPCEPMYQALIGKVPLPWESGADGYEERRRQLGTLRRLVMPCLERNPEERPDAGHLLQQWWHLCDVYAMLAPRQQSPTIPVPVTYTQQGGGTYNTFTTFNTVSSARGSAAVSTGVERADLVVPLPPSELTMPHRDSEIVPTPYASEPLEESTTILDSDAFEIAHLQTVQQNTASVPWGEDTADMMLPPPPTAAAPPFPAEPDARAEAYATSRAAIRKWAEGSAPRFQVRAGGSPNKRVRKKLSNVSSTNASGSTADEHHASGGQEGPTSKSGGTVSGRSMCVGSMTGSVTVAGGSAALLRALPTVSTLHTSPDVTRDDPSHGSRTKTVDGLSGAADGDTVHAYDDRAPRSVGSEDVKGDYPEIQHAVIPMRLR